MGWEVGPVFTPGMQSSSNIFSSGFFYEDFVLVPQKSRISYILNFAFRSIFCILIKEHQEQIAAGEIYSERLLDSLKQRNP